MKATLGDYMRIAILGAGFFGSCTALELSRRGFHVDLYDRHSDCMTQAGVRNEGKIHLGFVYGADSTSQTSDIMLQGSLEFYPLLRRWLGQSVDTISVSSPVIYAVDHQSLLSIEHIENYFLHIDRYLNKYASTRTVDYPGGSYLESVQRLSKDELSTTFNPDRVVAAFRTPERAIDVQQVGVLLRERIKQSKEISFYSGSEIQRIEKFTDHYQLNYQRNRECSIRNYDVVVNALWCGRLAIDSQLGIKEASPWIFRLKHAIFLNCLEEASIPSVTIIQGAFGDLVNFGKGSFYLSWYPSSMRGSSTDLMPPSHWKQELDHEEAWKLVLDNIYHLSCYAPSLQAIDPRNIRQWNVRGGIIYAKGKSDISDPQSELHHRHKVKIRKYENYFSVDPGKYCLCPTFANQLADMIVRL